MEYREGVPYDTCVGCGKEFVAYELLYEGVEPDVHSPRCRWCTIKQAQEIYGVENVLLPNILFPTQQSEN